MIIKSLEEISGASGCGGMADAQDSKSCGGDLVWVQVPPSALNPEDDCFQGFCLYKNLGEQYEKTDKIDHGVVLCPFADDKRL